MLSRKNFGISNKIRIIQKIIFGVFILIVFSYPIMSYMTINSITEVKVLEKYTKRDDAENNDKFMIVMEKKNGKKEVFENTDSLIQFKFNSADVQANLTIYKCYNIKANMFRLPFFSTYRNILKVKEISCQEKKNKRVN